MFKDKAKKKVNTIDNYFVPMPRSPLPITRTVKLAFDKCAYWVFQSMDVADPNYPDTWKAISRFCRWWIADHGVHGDLRDVYGLLQLMEPMSVVALKKLTAFPDDLEMIPATLKIQASYLPPTMDYEDFVVREYGEQKFCYKAEIPDYLTPKSVKYSKLAIKLGMDPVAAEDNSQVVEFFRQRRKNKKRKFDSFADYDAATPWKPLTQSLGDIPNPKYDPTLIDSDDSDDNKLMV